MAYYKAFADKYSDLKHTQDGWCIKVEATKQLETEWGLVWYYPHAKYTGRDGYLNCKTNVYNTSIQSFATGDIVPIGLVYTWHATRHMDMMIVNTVHDSLIAEVPDVELDEYREISSECLTKRVYNYLKYVYNIEFSVDLGVEYTVGDRWSRLADGFEEIMVRVDTPYPMMKQLEEVA